MTSSKTARAFIHVLLIVVGIVWIYPFVWMVSSSLKDNVTFYKAAINPIPEVFMLENYARAWDVANISHYFMNSVIITVSTVLIVVILSCLTGYALGTVAFPGRTAMIGFIVALQFIQRLYDHTAVPARQVSGDQRLVSGSDFCGIVGRACLVHPAVRRLLLQVSERN